MKDKILDTAKQLQSELVALRRDFHRHAESAWTEFRTASIVAKHLEEAGYEVYWGEDVIDEASMMGVPPKEVLEKQMERAKAQGAHAKYLDKMKGGKTGVVGILKTGKPGPVIALRFEMDSNEMDESTDPNHRPNKEGFASVNALAMHACGHDGHVATGIGVAKVLAKFKDDYTGTIKLIFQPAEEGVRGAASMVAKGLVDDADYTLGMHLGFSVDKNGQFICGCGGLLATSKFDAIFKGVPAHAGARPEEGKSALLAAAAASLSVQGIYRHSAGASRINIGVLQAGTGRNVVPENAIIKLETRGASSDINGFMEKEAIRMINASAAMYDCQVRTEATGAAMSAESDPELITLTKQVAVELGIFDDIRETENLGFSEDYSFFMDKVQKKGGKANYFMVGTNLAAGHHDSRFDFDEDVIYKGVAVTALLAYRLGQGR